MSRENVIRQRRNRELMEQGYTECADCHQLVRPGAMICPNCRKLRPAGTQAIVMLVTVIVLVAAASAYYLMPEDGGYVPPSDVPAVLSASPTGLSVPITATLSVTFNRDMNRTSVQSAFSVSPSIPGTFSWNGNTMVYTPSTDMGAGVSYTVTIRSTAVDATGQSLDSGTYSWYFTTVGGSTAALRSIGTGSDQFWSRSVSHPAWVLTALQTKPQLIFTHSEGCAPCVTQTGINENVYASYQSYISYYDLLSGTDEPQATETFGAYDPDGEPHYVPLTIVLTKGPDGAIIWHSWEGVIDEGTLSSWIEDAIEYHDQYG